MDILTHVMVGAAATAPFWVTHPLESVAFVFGSVLPDTDALSRQFGKVAYLNAHQTWTHAIPLHIAFAAAGAGSMYVLDMAILAPSFAAMGAGAVVHSLLDWTNTYGVQLFAPFDRSRRCLEWVFFIDSIVIAATSITLAIQAAMLWSSGITNGAVTLAWLVAMVGYFCWKAVLRNRAVDVRPGAGAMIPSALVPWRYYALSVEGQTATTCTVNALERTVSDVATQAIHGASDLQDLPEYRAMRDLSDGFLPTFRDGETVVLEDLRTPNFGGNFGRLTVRFHDGEPFVECFDV